MKKNLKNLRLIHTWYGTIERNTLRTNGKCYKVVNHYYLKQSLPTWFNLILTETGIKIIDIYDLKFSD